MTNTIKTGTILIAERALLSESILLESEPYLYGWRLVKNLESQGLDQIVSNAGWNFLYIASAIETNAFGSDEKKTTRKAIKQILANLKSKNFNCLEITQVAAKRSLGLPYVSVSAHSRHIQKGLAPFREPTHLADRQVSSSLRRAQMMDANLHASSTSESVTSDTVDCSQDLSRYREFQLGSDLLAVAKHAHLKPSQARTIHQHPAVIQELVWQAPLGDSSGSIKEIVFSFYNRELFRMAVTYDPEQTEGMTAEDLVEAISARYGTVTRPVAEITLSSTYLYSDGEKGNSDRSEKILARWEDSQYSLNLFQPSYQSTFGMVIFAKRLDVLARTAIIEAIRLDKQEAPERERERRKKKDEESRAKQEKARRVNKASFRP